MQISVRTLRLLTLVVFVPHQSTSHHFPKEAPPSKTLFTHEVEQASIGGHHLLRYHPKCQRVLHGVVPTPPQPGTAGLWERNWTGTALAPGMAEVSSCFQS